MSRTRSDHPSPKVQDIGAKISRRTADRLRSGHLWVYASDIESLELPTGEPPALVPVADSRGLLLGTALYSPASQIALRLVSREAIGEAELAAISWNPGCARQSGGGVRCSTSGPMPAGCASARPTNCPA